MNITKHDIDTIVWEERLKNWNGSLFLSSDWLNALRSNDRLPVYFYFKEHGEVKAMVGGLQRPVTNSDGKQLFFYSGIASSIDESTFLNRCKNELLQYAKDNNYSRITFKSYDYNDSIFALNKNYYPFERAEYIIDLKREKNIIIEGFAIRYRRYIRKAKKMGAIFKHGYTEILLDKLVNLMNDTKEKRLSRGYGNYEIFTMPFLDINVMKKLLKNKAAIIYYIEYFGEIVSIQFVVQAAYKAYGLYMGTSLKGYEISAPSLLYYEITLAYVEKHYYTYNLGGLPLGQKNQGIDRIKKFMGADKIKSYEEATDFLIGSGIKFNKYIWMKRFLYKIRMPWRIKRIFHRKIDSFLNGVDGY